MSFFRKIVVAIIMLQVGVLSAGAVFSIRDSGGDATVRYCNNGECGIDEGTQIIQDNLDGIVTDRSASQYVQDIVIFLLGFLALVAVIYIIYAGFQILVSAGDEEKVKKSKNIIVYAFIGLIVIFLAWSIVRFMFNVLGL